MHHMLNNELSPNVRALEERLISFIRAFGLHQPGQTPCGQPLSVSEAHALTELQKDGGLTASDLAKRLRLEKSTVSRLIAQLEKRGWVERRPHPKDGRASALYLSQQGQHVAGQVVTARHDKLTRLFDALPESERAAVIGALSTLTEALDEAVIENAPDDMSNEETMHATAL